jgi:uncharacterized protein YxjI
MEIDNMYEIKQNNGHYELYVNGKFYCSADTFTEAAQEIDRMRFDDRIGGEAK